MRLTARRSLVLLAAAVVLAAPLVATTTASAAPVRLSTDRGVEAWFHERGVVAGHTGNTHTIHIGVGKADDGTVTLSGFVYDQKCAPGVHLRAIDFGRDTGICPLLHTWILSSTNAQLTHMDAIKLNTAHVVADVTLTSLHGTGTPRVEHVDLTWTGTGAVGVYPGFEPPPGTNPVGYYRESTVAGAVGPMTLEDNPRDNQMSHMQSQVVYLAA